MILGSKAIIAALESGEIKLRKLVDVGGKFRMEDSVAYTKSGSVKADWAEQFVQPASLDIPLGNFIYAVPPVSDSRGGQFSVAVTPNPAVTSDDPIIHYQKFDLTDRPKGMAIMPGATILAHTEDFIELGEGLACQVATRSTARRWGLDVCGSAGWVDPGFNNRITLEVQNTNTIPVFIRKGVCYAQLVFMRVEDADPYTGHYNLGPDAWRPEMMLPKAL